VEADAVGVSPRTGRGQAGCQGWGGGELVDDGGSTEGAATYRHGVSRR
jgi:hypothetical protein